MALRAGLCGRLSKSWEEQLGEEEGGEVVGLPLGLEAVFSQCPGCCLDLEPTKVRS